MSRQKTRSGFTRREFGQSVGAGAAAGMAARCSFTRAAEPGRVLGPGRIQITLEVNGRKRSLNVEPRTTLLVALREGLDLTGPKPACDRGACGACTVLLEGEPVCACLLLALDAEGRAVTTIEGLAAGGRLDPLQQAFVSRDALQCGFCTPGMIMSCKALLLKTPRPGLDEIKAAVAGNLCRCGTYPRVFEAVLQASGQKVG